MIIQQFINNETEKINSLPKLPLSLCYLTEDKKQTNPMKMVDVEAYNNLEVVSAYHKPITKSLINNEFGK